MPYKVCHAFLYADGFCMMPQRKNKKHISFKRNAYFVRTILLVVFALCNRLETKPLRKPRFPGLSRCCPEGRYPGKTRADARGLFPATYAWRTCSAYIH